MDVTMFLMVSAVALLVGPAVASPTMKSRTGNSIIDLADKYNKSLSMEYFVDEVVKDECGAVFFCKVHNVLNLHEHFGKMGEEKVLVRNLEQYMNSITKSGNCTELLKEVTSTGTKQPIPQLLENLVACIKHRNLAGSS